MTIEIILLALASAVRPASLVAVYALVRELPPARLMAAYVAAGLAFTVTVGVAVTFVCNGIELHAGTDRTKAIAEILAGVLALGLGIAVLTGRLRVGAVTSGRPTGGRGSVFASARSRPALRRSRALPRTSPGSSTSWPSI